MLEIKLTNTAKIKDQIHSLPSLPQKHTHIYIYIYIYIFGKEQIYFLLIKIDYIALVYIQQKLSTG